MMLLTKQNKKDLPKLYAQDGKGDGAIIHVKFFLPNSAATWYAMEFDGEDEFFGLVDLGLGFPELGYFSLSELENLVSQPIRIRGLTGRKELPGMKVERDLHWTPKTLGEVRDSLRA